MEVLARRPGAFVQTFKVEGENHSWTLLSILNTFLAHGITGSEVIHLFIPKVLTAEEAWKLPISAWQPMKVRTVDFLKATPGPGCEPLPSVCPYLGPSAAQPISTQGPAPGGVLPRPTTPSALALRRQGSLQKSIPPRKQRREPTPPAPKVPKQALVKGKPLTPRQRRRQFTPNKSVLMNEDEPEQLSSRPQRLRVHLQRGLEAEMSWPAFHAEGSECYFSGRTVPVVLRTISRPGGQLLQVIPKRTQAIIIKRIGKNEPFSYFVAYGPATRTFLLGLQNSDWKPCHYFNILGHDYLA